MNIGIRICLLFMQLALLLPANLAWGVLAAEETERDREWNFKVFLDDKEIGYHHFSLDEDEQETRLVTEADFKVKFLFITAYSYEHRNMEMWRDGCLLNIEASTNANGKTFEVSGNRDGTEFNIESNQQQSRIRGCVKTFAYWDPDFLSESTLLNAQTGELLDVTVGPPSNETLIVSGEQIAANRYHLSAKGIEIDVWYSSDRRWLALESTVKGGRKLRYELA